MGEGDEKRGEEVGRRGGGGGGGVRLDCIFMLKVFLTPKAPDYDTYRQFQHTETLCSAHTVYLGFVLFSQQTAIISIYSINWLVLVTETVFTARYGLTVCKDAAT